MPMRWSSVVALARRGRPVRGRRVGDAVTSGNTNTPMAMIAPQRGELIVAARRNAAQATSSSPRT
jgi:hypothetical protein